MPADTLLVLQASTTKTATFQGAGLNILTGVAPNQTLVARVIYSAASTATSTATFTFTVEESTDNVNYAVAGGGGFPSVAQLTTVPSSGEIFIPFNVRTAVGTPCFIRLVATLVLVGTVPTITYQGDTVIAYP